MGEDPHTPTYSYIMAIHKNARGDMSFYKIIHLGSYHYLDLEGVAKFGK